MITASMNNYRRNTLDNQLILARGVKTPTNMSNAPQRTKVTDGNFHSNSLGKSNMLARSNTLFATPDLIVSNRCNNASMQPHLQTVESLITKSAKNFNATAMNVGTPRNCMPTGRPPSHSAKRYSNRSLSKTPASKASAEKFMQQRTIYGRLHSQTESGTPKTDLHSRDFSSGNLFGNGMADFDLENKKPFGENRANDTSCRSYSRTSNDITRKTIRQEINETNLDAKAILDHFAQQFRVSNKNLNRNFKPVRQLSQKTDTSPFNVQAKLAEIEDFNNAALENSKRAQENFLQNVPAPHKLFYKKMSMVGKAKTESKIIKPSTPSIRSEFSSEGSSSIDDYSIGKQIGQGAYAAVKTGVHKITNNKIAVKVYDKFRLMDPQKRKNVLREIRILQRLEHSNIVRLYESIDTSKHVNIIMEYAKGCSMHAYLKAKNGRRLPENEARHVFKQVVGGIAYCHAKNVVHRDIKLENLIIDEASTIKIIDFGFSICLNPDQKVKIFCGTPSYMAPEIVSKRDYYGPPADVWALGVLLFVLLCGTFPFRGASDKELYAKINKGLFTIPDHVSKEGRRLLLRILTVEPSKRPTAAEIMNDKWMTSSFDTPFLDMSSGLKLSIGSNTMINSNKEDQHLEHLKKQKFEKVDKDVLDHFRKLGFSQDEIFEKLKDEKSDIHKIYKRLVEDKRVPLTQI